MFIRTPIIYLAAFLQVGSSGKLATPPHELSGQAGGSCGKQAQGSLLISRHSFCSNGFLLRVGVVKVDLSIGTKGVVLRINKNV